MAKNGNVRGRAATIKKMVEMHYEPGRQDRCKLWVFRTVVMRQYPISERTFWRYLNIKDEVAEAEDGRQMKIEFEN